MTYPVEFQPTAGKVVSITENGFSILSPRPGDFEHYIYNTSNFCAQVNDIVLVSRRRNPMRPQYPQVKTVFLLYHEPH